MGGSFAERGGGRSVVINKSGRESGTEMGERCRFLVWLEINGVQGLGLGDINIASPGLGQWVSYLMGPW